MIIFFKSWYKWVVSIKGYLFCSYTERYDSIKFAQQLEIEVVWEDRDLQEKLGLEVAPRFTEGNYNNFFSKL